MARHREMPGQAVTAGTGPGGTATVTAPRVEGRRRRPPCYTPSVLDSRGTAPQTKQEEALLEEGATFAP
jgi:hypothetical protein